MVEAARSRKLVAQGRLRLWAGATTPEEARAYLQARLNAYSKIMFWSFVALLVFLSLAYRFSLEGPWRQPEYVEVVFGGSAILLAVMAFVWRAVLYRKQLSVEALYRIDLVYAITIGGAFGASAALQYDLKPAAYTSLIFGAYNVFTRALFVPSSAKRTAVVSSATFLPIVLGGVWLGLTTHEDLPPGAFIVGGCTLSVIAIVIAANGSAIIYTLRREAEQAMQLGAYTLDRKIGSGGMGTVYRAHHLLLRRATAIKLILPDHTGAVNHERFEREVQAMSKLTHPNTVAVYDYGPTPDGSFYYAMEYLDGLDLEQLVKLHGPQRAARVAHILAQVCGALQEAHDAGMIHRDIKPANIILCQRGGVPDVAKVVDFGLVKEITRDSGESMQAILGTPSYVAPEVVLGGEVGPAVDIYALGCVGYFLLTGRRVFAADTQLATCIQHVTEPPRSMRDGVDNPIPPDLEATILRCLEKQPADRFASASALAEALVRPAVDRSGGWGVTEAAAWWRDQFRGAESAPLPQDETLTVTVDLDRRSA